MFILFLIYIYVEIILVVRFSSPFASQIFLGYRILFSYILIDRLSRFKRNRFHNSGHGNWLSELETEVTLRLTVSQSVCLGIEYPSRTCDQILFLFVMLLSEICGLVSLGRLLWREDGSAICSVITHWSESLRTRNHTLLSHLRLPQPGGPGSHIYIPQDQGGPVISQSNGFPLRRLLRLAELRWRYSNPPPTWGDRPLYI
jgi:hypothetical protein